MSSDRIEDETGFSIPIDRVPKLLDDLSHLEATVPEAAQALHMGILLGMARLPYDEIGYHTRITLAAQQIVAMNIHFDLTGRTAEDYAIRYNVPGAG